MSPLLPICILALLCVVGVAGGRRDAAPPTARGHRDAAAVKSHIVVLPQSPAPASPSLYDAVLGAQGDLRGSLGAAAPSLIFNQTYTNTTWFRFLFDQPGVIFVASFDFMLAVSKANGNALWYYPDTTAFVITNTAYGVLILTNTDSVVAIRADTGTLLWTLANAFEDVVVDQSSPLPVLYGLDFSLNSLQCLDGLTGASVWTTRIIGSTVNTNLLAADQGRVFVEMITGDVFYISAYNAVDGSLMWQSPPLYGYPFDYLNLNIPGAVYINSGNYLCKLDASAGAVLWNATAPMYAGNINILPDSVYVVNAATLYRVSPDTGVLLWKHTLCTQCTYGSVVGDDASVVYLDVLSMSTDQLWAFSKTTGTALWSRSYSYNGVEDVAIDGKGNVMYLVSDVNAYYTMYCASGATGEAHWSVSFATKQETMQSCNLPLPPSPTGAIFVVCDSNILGFQLPGTGSPGGSNAGAIAGAVLGTIFGVAAIAAAVVYVRKHGNPFAGRMGVTGSSSGSYVASSSYQAVGPTAYST